MSIVLQITETTRNPSYPSATLATHTLAVDINDIVVNNSDDSTLNNYATTPQTMTEKYNTSDSGRNMTYASADLKFYIGEDYVRRARYYGSGIVNANVEAPMSRTNYWWDTTHKVSDYFNAENKTTLSIPVNYTYSGQLQTGIYFNGGMMEIASGRYSDVPKGSINLRLNVPPTFDNTSLSFDTSSPYTNITTASVTVSNATAYYGGDISSATLTIGNQTASISGNGTISILLNAGGTFTPTVTVTDSRGQTATRTLDPITVNVYTAPSVSFTVERTTATGAPEDEGAYATVDATFTFADVIADAVAPTVTVTDKDGVQTTPTVTWYSSRATDGTLSGSVTWANLSSGDTVYGLIPNLNTEFSWQIAITPRDTEGAGTPITQTLAGAFYTIDFLAGGHGIAFGQPASDVGFFCNMDAHFVDANSVMRALFDFVYPVGSYYETSDTAFDPNTTWGGTWVLETEGMVHVSGGTNYAVAKANNNNGQGEKDGGEATVTLSVDEIPSHRHGMDYYMNNSTTPGGQYVAWGRENGGAHYTTYTGGGQPHNNMQPYISVNRWHRTA